MNGTFDLVLLQDTPPFTRHAVRNLVFTTSPGCHGQAHLAGSGTSQTYSEFGVLQEMELTTRIANQVTNQVA